VSPSNASARSPALPPGLAGFAWLLLLPLSGLGCHSGPAPEEQLASASAQVTFTSVEQLGPHHYVSSVQRTDSRPGSPDRVMDEVVEISWQDWDDFHVRRIMDGQAERETVVSGGRVWVKSGEQWEPRDDAEPHRVQLRSTWNTWDEVLGSHSDHIRLVPDGDDIVEGRPASRFHLEMLPADQAPRPRAYGFQPTAIEGTVWLDEATAVRLKVELVATATRQALTRTTRFTLQRSNIGLDQGISPPR